MRNPLEVGKYYLLWLCLSVSLLTYIVEPLNEPMNFRNMVESLSIGV